MSTSQNESKPLTNDNFERIWKRRLHDFYRLSDTLTTEQVAVLRDSIEQIERLIEVSVEQRNNQHKNIPEGLELALGDLHTRHNLSELNGRIKNVDRLSNCDNRWGIEAEVESLGVAITLKDDISSVDGLSVEESIPPEPGKPGYVVATYREE